MLERDRATGLPRVFLLITEDVDVISFFNDSVLKQMSSGASTGASPQMSLGTEKRHIATSNTGVLYFIQNAVCQAYSEGLMD